MKNSLHRNFTATYILTTLALCSPAQADIAGGLIGGQPSAMGGYATFISPTGQPNTPITGLTAPVNSVALNDAGNGLLGGSYMGAYAAFVTSGSGGPTTIFGLPLTGNINSVAINNEGSGLIGGQDTGGAYAAFVTYNNTTPTSVIVGLPPTGNINSVALNSAGSGLIGGQNVTNAYSAFVTYGSSAATVITSPGAGTIRSVQINSSGNGLLGGESGTAAYAAFVSFGNPTPSATPSLPTPGDTNSVAINDSGMGLIGGKSGAAAYAAFVTSGSAPSFLPVPASGNIFSVAINSLGNGLIGGQSSGSAYAAFVSSSGSLTPINGLPASGVIKSVAINKFGAALLGGQNTSSNTAIAFLVTPLGEVVDISPFLPPGSSINSVSVTNFLLSQIPTTGLNGNILILADYININAPELVSYLIPAELSGKLVQALESIAPMRNLYGKISAANNMAAATQALTDRATTARNNMKTTGWRAREIEAVHNYNPSFSPAPLQKNSSGLLASNAEDVPLSKTEKRKEEGPFEFWMSALGTFAHQKKEHQSVGYNPSTAGLLCAFDARVSARTRLGIGTGYSYTHIHEKNDAGFANTNQEYLFVYSLWSSENLYCDTSLWAGWFQNHGRRHVRMTGFEFFSKCHSKGWLLTPHFEIGYDKFSSSKKMTYEPFLMLDWVANWHGGSEEKGNNPFNMGHRHHFSSLLRTEVGLRLFEVVEFDRCFLTIQEKVSYVNKKPFQMGRLRAYIVGVPEEFTVQTFTTPQNLGVAKFELTFQPKARNYFWGSISYQGEFGSKFIAHIVALTGNWNF
ncbi:MAG: autotransporter outer membrane beta-barrel domain-containing protein [Verrucomicrobia bacterium]|nr:autotransporter outer membrane beta-barrel domain-containing protein [Verrucomicrobiota bacterium]